MAPDSTHWFSARNILHYDRRIALAIFAAAVIWECIGIFPLTSYEADALSISTAVKYPWHEGYGRWMQPLTYRILDLFKAGNVEQAYCALTAICAVGLLWVSAALVRMLSGLPRTLSIISVLLIPETYYLAMYPNSSAPALLCVFSAFLLLMKGRTAWGAVLLAIAPLLRLDVLVIYIAVPFILRSSGASWRRAAAVTAAIVLWVLTAIISGYWLLGGNIEHTYSEFMRWQGIITPAKRLIAFIGFYSPTGFILVMLGLWQMRHRPLLLATTLLPIFFLHIVEFRFANAAKHFAPLIPFAAVAVGFALRWISRQPRLLRGVGIAIVLLSQIVCIDLRPDTLNALRPQIFKFIGAGQDANTCDEVIILSGNLFYPFFIHELKDESLRREEEFTHWVYRKNAVFVTGTYEASERWLAVTGANDSLPSVYIDAPLPLTGRASDLRAEKDRFLDSIHSLNAPALLASPNPINYKYDLFLENLWHDGRLEKLSDHVYITTAP